jgi:hypothetical protein
MIASAGQTPAQAPQAMHSSLTTAFPSSMVMAFIGHTSAHCPQPTHFKTSMVAFIESDLLEGIVFRFQLFS